MAISLTHTTVAVGTDAGNGEIAKAQWNENHTLTQATERLLGRTTAGVGATEEISVGTGLSLSGGTLTNTVTATTPGGSNTQLQFNSSGSFAGASGLTTNGTELTIASGTKTASAPLLDATQTWNAGGVTFTGMKLNVTDTASAAASLLADFQVGGSTKFSVNKSGLLRTTVGNNNLHYEVGTTGTGIGNFFGTLGLFSSGTMIAVAQNSGFRVHTGTLTVGSSDDLILRRRGAANLALGGADAAAPVAQTLSVQSVVAGTTNTAGANFTITGSQGTGTGAGGSIIFQTAPAGSSGTAQNALVNRLTIPASGTPFAFAGAATGSLDLTCSTFAQLFARGGGVNMNIGAGFSIGIVGTENGYPVEVRTSNATRLTFGTSGGLTIADANDIAVGTTTGTKIGTAISQKIGFWNATPIVQPTTAVAEATFVENSGGTAVNVDSTFDGYTVQQVVKALRNAGLLA